MLGVVPRRLLNKYAGLIKFFGDIINLIHTTKHAGGKQQCPHFFCEVGGVATKGSDHGSICQTKIAFRASGIVSFL